MAASEGTWTTFFGKINCVNTERVIVCSPSVYASNGSNELAKLKKGKNHMSFVVVVIFVNGEDRGVHIAQSVCAAIGGRLNTSCQLVYIINSMMGAHAYEKPKQVLLLILKLNMRMLVHRRGMRCLATRRRGEQK